MNAYTTIITSAATLMAAGGMYLLIKRLRLLARVNRARRECEERKEAEERTKILVTNQNFVELQEALDTLIKNFNTIVHLTKRFPVIIVFAGYRRVFENEQDAADLIKELQEKIGKFIPAF